MPVGRAKIAIAHDLARIVAASSYEGLSDAVAGHSLRTFVNFAGCAMGAADHEMVRATERAMAAPDAAGSCHVIGRPMRTSAVVAALINGVAGAVNAYDDTHAEAIIHPGPPVGAALVAASGIAGSPVSGREFLLANAWGVEIACRLSKAISVGPAKAPMGWSQTGICAPAGAAAACARLLRLDEDRTARAIGIAASSASGLRAAHGTMAMHLAPAQAAMTGVQSALLAQAGVTGPENVFEGRYGFFELFGEIAHPAYLVDGLGARFELLSNMFKAYPAGIVIHAVIDACLELGGGRPFTPDEIAGVRMEVPAATKALCDRPAPHGVFEAQVSAQHWAAGTLLRGSAGLGLLDPAAISDPAITALRQRCKMVERPDMPADSAIVTLALADSSSRQACIDHYRGALERPLDEAAISRKFLDQATPVAGEAVARRFLDACWSIPDQDDVRPIWRLSLPSDE